MNEFRNFLTQDLFAFGSTDVTGSMVVAATVVVIATLVLAQLSRRITIRHFDRHHAGDDVSAKSVAKLVAGMVVLVGLDIFLHIFGIRLATLFAASGMFALAVGFAAKDSVANYLAGIILRIDRTISRGDVIQLDDRWLKIQQIGFRSTVGRTVNDEQILVPNSKLAQSTVTNLTREDELILIKATIPVDLSSDAELVERVLREVVESLDWVSSKAKSGVILSEINRFSIEFVIGVWIEDTSTVFRSRSELYIASWSALQEAGVFDSE